MLIIGIIAIFVSGLIIDYAICNDEAPFGALGVCVLITGIGVVAFSRLDMPQPYSDAKINTQVIIYENDTWQVINSEELDGRDWFNVPNYPVEGVK